MTPLLSFSRSLLLLSVCLVWSSVNAQMLGSWSGDNQLERRQNNRPDTSAFNIVNGRVFTPGLGIILAVRLDHQV
jgi:Mn2+/Fe2+ NRAMP family transporter